MLTCRQEIALLPAHAAGELGRVMRARFLLHLAVCAACRAYRRTYRATIALVARAGDVPMPEEMQARLRHFLSARLREQRN